ncbi:MAG: DNA-directed RNA polymerase subunit alpha C-terminal domain-containing protein [Candidatus Saccharimonadales bacterium]
MSDSDLELSATARLIEEAIREARECGKREGILEERARIKEVLNRVTRHSMPDSEEFLDTDINDLGLSERPRSALKREGVDTVRQLIRKTENDLLGYSHFGMRSLDEVVNVLAKHGFFLRPLP